MYVQLDEHLGVMYACPAHCENYVKYGMRYDRDQRRHHKNDCIAESGRRYLRCAIDSTCRTSHGEKLFTTQNLLKHVNEKHGGFTTLCKPAVNTDLRDRLAVSLRRA